MATGIAPSYTRRLCHGPGSAAPKHSALKGRYNLSALQGRSMVFPTLACFAIRTIRVTVSMLVLG